jgi:hypothetical protein
MVSLQPFGFLVREAFPGGAAHFDSISKAFASLNNLGLEPIAQGSASKEAKTGMPACRHAGLRPFAKAAIAG